MMTVVVSNDSYAVLSEVQTLLVRLEHLCAQMSTVPEVVTTAMPVAGESSTSVDESSYRSLRELRLDRGWPQSEVVDRLRRLAHEELSCDLLNQYKRWERGRNAPSRFYTRLLCLVFGVDDIAFTRPVRRRAVNTAPVRLVGQAA